MLKGESWKAQNAQEREREREKSNSAARMCLINWANFMFL